MERLTGKGAQSLNEAYQQVYTSVITEEVINSTAEQWVSACIEEGVKFEEYTLDEITEAFIADCEQPEVLNEFLGMPSAQNFGADMRQRFGQARRAVGGALNKFGAGVKDVAGATAQGLVGQRTTSNNPIARFGNMVTRTATAPQRAIGSAVGGFLTGRGANNNTAGTPPAAPAGNTVASKAPPAAPKPEKTYDVAGEKMTTSQIKARQDSLRSDPAAAKKFGNAAFAAVNPKIAAANAERARTRGTSATTNPLMKDFKSRMPAPAPAKPAGSPAAQAAAGAPNRKEDLFTGKPIPSAKPGAVGAVAKPANAPVVRSNNINLPSAAVPKTRLDAALTGIKPGAGVPGAGVKPMAAASAAPTGAAAPKPMARPTGTRPMGARNRMREELDVFDTIKEYLIGEGATEEEALKQMLNLTDEQRTEILEGSCGSKMKKKGGYKK